MRLLLIGARGQLARDVQRLASEDDAVDLVVRGSDVLDVTDPDSVASNISEIKPDVIINTAAYHEVDTCETEVSRAMAVNVDGAENVARAAADIGAALVHLSTDYVFSGTNRTTPYSEEDEAYPLSVYGSSKLEGERRILTMLPSAKIIRTCGLYGESPPSGKQANFPQAILVKAKKGEPLRVVNDQICTPTWTRPLAAIVLDLAKRGNSAPLGILHATCQGSCSWFQFAQTILGFAGIDAHIEAISSSELNQAARRPLYSVLANKKLAEAGLDTLPHWREALSGYLKTIGEMN